MERFNDDFLRVVERIEQSFELVEERFAILKEERDTLFDQVISLTEDSESLLKQLQERQDHEHQLLVRIQELEQQCETYRLTSEESTSRVDALTADTLQKEALITTLQQSLEEFESVQKELEEAKRTARESHNLLSGHEEEVRSLRKRQESDVAAWEARLAESNKDHAELAEKIEQTIRERDQARATVESMLIRVRQLETNDEEQRASLRNRTEELTRDLEDALDMASSKEGENDELKRKIDQLEAKLSEFDSQHLISSEEQSLLIAEVETALSLIDRHLVTSTGGA